MSRKRKVFADRKRIGYDAQLKLLPPEIFSNEPMSEPDILQTILKDSNYNLSLFTKDELAALRKKIFLKDVRGQEKPYIKCLIRGRDILLKPEETVRQLYAARLIEEYGYPKKRIVFEYSVTFGREKKKADIAVLDKDRPETPRKFWWR